jgi:hypothetical protein
LFEQDSELKTIKSKAFASCGVMSIVIPKHVTIIGESSFSHCRGLKSIMFERDCELKVIESKGFIFCGMTSIVIPKHVTMIGESCFANCKFLLEVSFESESEVRQLKAKAFACSGLSSIGIPKSVEVIGSSCFLDCQSLSSISFEPHSRLKRIKAQCFERVDLDDLAASGFVRKRDFLIRGCRIVGYFRDLCDVIIPLDISVLGTKAFFESGTKRVMVPEFSKLAAIESFCFASSALQEICLDERIRRLRSIGDSCFANTHLISIRIPESVKVLGSRCFFRCRSLSRVEFVGRRRLESLGKLCLASTAITSLVLPRQIGSLHATALRTDFLGMLSVQWPEVHCTKSDQVPDELFVKDRLILTSSKTNLIGYYGSTQLASLEIPESVCTLAPFALSGLTLEEIKLPDGLAVLGDYCFSGCTKLNRLHLKLDSLKRIGGHCFEQTALKTFPIPASLEFLDPAAFTGSSIVPSWREPLTKFRLQIFTVRTASGMALPPGFSVSGGKSA